MKKVFSFIIVIALCLSLCACGQSAPEGLSDEMFKLGKQALKVMDQYFEGKISDEKAVEELDKLYELSKAESDYLSKRMEESLDTDNFEEFANVAITSGYVPFYISCLQMGILEIPNIHGVIYDCQECYDNLYDIVYGE